MKHLSIKLFLFLTLLCGSTQAADTTTPDKTNKQIIEEAALEGVYSTFKAFIVMGLLSHFAIANQYQAGVPGVTALAIIEGLKAGRDEYYEKIAAQKDVDREEVMPKNWITFLLKTTTLLTRAYFIAALGKTFIDTITKNMADYKAEAEKLQLTHEENEKKRQEMYDNIRDREELLDSIINKKSPSRSKKDTTIPAADRKSLLRDSAVVRALDIQSIFKRPTIGISDFYPSNSSWQALKHSFFLASKNL